MDLENDEALLNDQLAQGIDAPVDPPQGSKVGTSRMAGPAKRPEVFNVNAYNAALANIGRGVVSEANPLHEADRPGKFRAEDLNEYDRLGVTPTTLDAQYNQNALAEHQGSWERVSRTFNRFIYGTAAETVGSLAGLAYGAGAYVSSLRGPNLLSALANGDASKIIDNDFMTRMEKFKEEYQQENQVYQSTGYQEAGVTRFFIEPLSFTSEYMDSIAFIAGMTATAALTSGGSLLAKGALSGVTKGGRLMALGRSTVAVGEGARAAEIGVAAAGLTGRGQGLLRAVGKIGEHSKAIALGSAWESMVEAHQSMGQIEKDLVGRGMDEESAKRLAKDGAMTSFWLNLVLTYGTNMITFPSLGKLASGAISKIPKIPNVDLVGKTVKGAFGKEVARHEASRLSRYAGNAWDYGSGFIGEGAQEYLQNSVAGGLEDYYGDVYSADHIARSLDQFSSIFDFSKRYIGTGEGQHAILMGGMMGSAGFVNPAGVYGKITGKDMGAMWQGGIPEARRERKAERLAATQTALEINNFGGRDNHAGWLAYKNFAYNKATDSMRAAEEAIAAGDPAKAFAFEGDARYTNVAMFHKAGLGEVVDANAESIRKMSTDDFRDARPEETENMTDEEVDQLKNDAADDLLADNKAYREARKKVELAQPNASDLAKDEATRVLVQADFVGRKQADFESYMTEKFGRVRLAAEDGFVEASTRKLVEERTGEMESNLKEMRATLDKNEDIQAYFVDNPAATLEEALAALTPEQLAAAEDALGNEVAAYRSAQMSIGSYVGVGQTVPKDLAGVIADTVGREQLAWDREGMLEAIYSPKGRMGRLMGDAKAIDAQFGTAPGSPGSTSERIAGVMAERRGEPRGANLAEEYARLRTRARELTTGKVQTARKRAETSIEGITRELGALATASMAAADQQATDVMETRRDLLERMRDADQALLAGLDAFEQRRSDSEQRLSNTTDGTDARLSTGSLINEYNSLEDDMSSLMESVRLSAETSVAYIDALAAQKRENPTDAQQDSDVSDDVYIDRVRKFITEGKYRAAREAAKNIKRYDIKSELLNRMEKQLDGEVRVERLSAAIDAATSPEVKAMMQTGRDIEVMRQSLIRRYNEFFSSAAMTAWRGRMSFRKKLAEAGKTEAEAIEEMLRHQRFQATVGRDLARAADRVRARAVSSGLGSPAVIRATDDVADAIAGLSYEESDTIARLKRRIRRFENALKAMRELGADVDIDATTTELLREVETDVLYRTKVAAMMLAARLEYKETQAAAEKAAIEQAEAEAAATETVATPAAAPVVTATPDPVSTPATAPVVVPVATPNVADVTIGVLRFTSRGPSTEREVADGHAAIQELRDMFIVEYEANGGTDEDVFSGEIDTEIGESLTNAVRVLMSVLSFDGTDPTMRAEAEVVASEISMLITNADTSMTMGGGLISDTLAEVLKPYGISVIDKTAEQIAAYRLANPPTTNALAGSTATATPAPAAIPVVAPAVPGESGRMTEADHAEKMAAMTGLFTATTAESQAPFAAKLRALSAAFPIDLPPASVEEMIQRAGSVIIEDAADEAPGAEPEPTTRLKLDRAESPAAKNHSIAYANGDIELTLNGVDQGVRQALTRVPPHGKTADGRETGWARNATVRVVPYVENDKKTWGQGENQGNGVTSFSGYGAVRDTSLGVFARASDLGLAGDGEVLVGYLPDPNRFSVGDQAADLTNGVHQLMIVDRMTRKGVDAKGYVTNQGLKFVQALITLAENLKASGMTAVGAETTLSNLVGTGVRRESNFTGSGGTPVRDRDDLASLVEDPGALFDMPGLGRGIFVIQRDYDKISEGKGGSIKQGIRMRGFEQGGVTFIGEDGVATVLNADHREDFMAIAGAWLTRKTDQQAFPMDPRANQRFALVKEPTAADPAGMKAIDLSPGNFVLIEDGSPAADGIGLALTAVVDQLTDELPEGKTVDKLVTLVSPTSDRFYLPINDRTVRGLGAPRAAGSKVRYATLGVKSEDGRLYFQVQLSEGGLDGESALVALRRMTVHKVMAAVGTKQMTIEGYIVSEMNAQADRWYNTATVERARSRVLGVPFEYNSKAARIIAGDGGYMPSFSGITTEPRGAEALKSMSISGRRFVQVLTTPVASDGAKLSTSEIAGESRASRSRGKPSKIERQTAADRRRAAGSLRRKAAKEIERLQVLEVERQRTVAAAEVKRNAPKATTPSSSVEARSKAGITAVVDRNDPAALTPEQLEQQKLAYEKMAAMLSGGASASAQTTPATSATTSASVDARSKAGITPVVDKNDPGGLTAEQLEQQRLAYEKMAAMLSGSPGDSSASQETTPVLNEDPLADADLVDEPQAFRVDTEDIGPADPVGATEAFKQVFGDGVPTPVFDRLLTPSGMEALGVLRDGAPAFSRKANRYVGFHEAFHFAEDVVLSEAERNEVWAEAVDYYDAPTDAQLASINAVYDNRLTDDKAREIYYREELADGFAKYAVARDAAETELAVLPAIRRFFARLVNFLRNVITNRAVIDRVYAELYEGRLTNRSHRVRKTATEEMYMLVRHGDGRAIPQDAVGMVNDMILDRTMQRLVAGEIRTDDRIGASIERDAKIVTAELRAKAAALSIERGSDSVARRYYESREAGLRAEVDAAIESGRIAPEQKNAELLRLRPVLTTLARDMRRGQDLFNALADAYDRNDVLERLKEVVAAEATAQRSAAMYSYRINQENETEDEMLDEQDSQEVQQGSTGHDKSNSDFEGIAGLNGKVRFVFKQVRDTGNPMNLLDEVVALIDEPYLRRGSDKEHELYRRFLRQVEGSNPEEVIPRLMKAQDDDTREIAEAIVRSAAMELGMSREATRELLRGITRENFGDIVRRSHVVNAFSYQGNRARIKGVMSVFEKTRNWKTGQSSATVMMTMSKSAVNERRALISKWTKRFAARVYLDVDREQPVVPKSKHAISNTLTLVERLVGEGDVRGYISGRETLTKGETPAEDISVERSEYLDVHPDILPMTQAKATWVTDDDRRAYVDLLVSEVSRLMTRIGLPVSENLIRATIIHENKAVLERPIDGKSFALDFWRSYPGSAKYSTLSNYVGRNGDKKSIFSLLRADVAAARTDNASDQARMHFARVGAIGGASKSSRDRADQLTEKQKEGKKTDQFGNEKVGGLYAIAEAHAFYEGTLEGGADLSATNNMKQTDTQMSVLSKRVEDVRRNGGIAEIHGRLYRSDVERETAGESTARNAFTNGDFGFRDAAGNVVTTLDRTSDRIGEVEMPNETAAADAMLQSIQISEDRGTVTNVFGVRTATEAKDKDEVEAMSAFVNGYRKAVDNRHRIYITQGGDKMSYVETFDIQLYEASQATKLLMSIPKVAMRTKNKQGESEMTLQARSMARSIAEGEAGRMAGLLYHAAEIHADRAGWETRNGAVDKIVFGDPQLWGPQLRQALEAIAVGFPEGRRPSSREIAAAVKLGIAKTTWPDLLSGEPDAVKAAGEAGKKGYATIPGLSTQQYGTNPAVEFAQEMVSLGIVRVDDHTSTKEEGVPWVYKAVEKWVNERAEPWLQRMVELGIVNRADDGRYFNLGLTVSEGEEAYADTVAMSPVRDLLGRSKTNKPLPLAYEINGVGTKGYVLEMEGVYDMIFAAEVTLPVASSLLLGDLSRYGGIKPFQVRIGSVHSTFGREMDTKGVRAVTVTEARLKLSPADAARIGRPDLSEDAVDQDGNAFEGIAEADALNLMHPAARISQLTASMKLREGSRDYRTVSKIASGEDVGMKYENPEAYAKHNERVRRLDTHFSTVKTSGRKEGGMLKMLQVTFAIGEVAVPSDIGMQLAKEGKLTDEIRSRYGIWTEAKRALDDSHEFGRGDRGTLTDAVAVAADAYMELFEAADEFVAQRFGIMGQIMRAGADMAVMPSAAKLTDQAETYYSKSEYREQTPDPDKVGDDVNDSTQKQQLLTAFSAAEAEGAIEIGGASRKISDLVDIVHDLRSSHITRRSEANVAMGAEVFAALASDVKGRRLLKRLLKQGYQATGRVAEEIERIAGVDPRNIDFGPLAYIIENQLAANLRKTTLAPRLTGSKFNMISGFARAPLRRVLAKGASIAEIKSSDSDFAKYPDGHFVEYKGSWYMIGATLPQTAYRKGETAIGEVGGVIPVRLRYGVEKLLSDGSRAMVTEVAVSEPNARKLGVEVGKESVDPRDLSIGLRIPLQANGSMMRMEVVDVVGGATINAIATPAEWIAISGSDNDGDKVFASFTPKVDGVYVGEYARMTDPQKASERAYAEWMDERESGDSPHKLRADDALANDEGYASDRGTFYQMLDSISPEDKLGAPEVTSFTKRGAVVPDISDLVDPTIEEEIAAIVERTQGPLAKVFEWVDAQVESGKVTEDVAMRSIRNLQALYGKIAVAADKIRMPYLLPGYVTGVDEVALFSSIVMPGTRQTYGEIIASNTAAIRDRRYASYVPITEGDFEALMLELEGPMVLNEHNLSRTTSGIEVSSTLDAAAELNRVVGRGPKEWLSGNKLVEGTPLNSMLANLHARQTFLTSGKGVGVAAKINVTVASFDPGLILTEVRGQKLRLAAEVGDVTEGGPQVMSFLQHLGNLVSFPVDNPKQRDMEKIGLDADTFQRFVGLSLVATEVTNEDGSVEYGPGSQMRALAMVNHPVVQEVIRRTRSKSKSLSGYRRIDQKLFLESYEELLADMGLGKAFVENDKDKVKLYFEPEERGVPSVKDAVDSYKEWTERLDGPGFDFRNMKLADLTAAKALTDEAKRMDTLVRAFIESEDIGRKILSAAKFTNLLRGGTKGFEGYEQYRAAVIDAKLRHVYSEGRVVGLEELNDKREWVPLTRPTERGAYPNDAAVVQLLRNSPSLLARYIATANHYDAMATAYQAHSEIGRKYHRGLERILRTDYEKGRKGSIKVVKQYLQARHYRNWLTEQFGGSLPSVKVFAEIENVTDGSGEENSRLAAGFDRMQAFWAKEFDGEYNTFLDLTRVDYVTDKNGDIDGRKVAKVARDSNLDDDGSTARYTSDAVRVMDRIQQRITQIKTAKDSPYTYAELIDLRDTYNAVVYLSPLVNYGLEVSPTSLLKHLSSDMYAGFHQYLNRVTPSHTRDVLADQVTAQGVNSYEDMVALMSSYEFRNRHYGSIPFANEEAADLTYKSLPRQFTKVNQELPVAVANAVAKVLLKHGVIKDASEVRVAKKSAPVFSATGTKLQITPDNAFVFDLEGHSGTQTVAALYPIIEAMGTADPAAVLAEVHRVTIGTAQGIVQETLGRAVTLERMAPVNGDQKKNMVIAIRVPAIFPARQAKTHSKAGEDGGGRKKLARQPTRLMRLYGMRHKVNEGDTYPTWILPTGTKEGGGYVPVEGGDARRDELFNDVTWAAQTVAFEMIEPLSSSGFKGEFLNYVDRTVFHESVDARSMAEAAVELDSKIRFFREFYTADVNLLAEADVPGGDRAAEVERLVAKWFKGFSRDKRFRKYLRSLKPGEGLQGLTWEDTAEAEEDTVADNGGDADTATDETEVVKTSNKEMSALDKAIAKEGREEQLSPGEENLIQFSDYEMFFETEEWARIASGEMEMTEVVNLLVARQSDPTQIEKAKERTECRRLSADT